MHLHKTTTPRGKSRYLMVDLYIPPVLKIEPDDIIVLTSPGEMTDAAMIKCHEGAKRNFPGHKVALLTGGITLSVARPAAIPPTDPRDLGLITPGE